MKFAEAMTDKRVLFGRLHVLHGRDRYFVADGEIWRAAGLGYVLDGGESMDDDEIAALADADVSLVDAARPWRRCPSARSNAA